MAKISNTELVNKVYNFCELYSGISFFPYQKQFAKRIIRSVIENDGEEITALFSRQSGKSEVVATVTGGLSIILPTLANLPMFAEDTRLQPFANGFLCGIFAPAQQQAQIAFNRAKQRMFSKQSMEVMQDPDILVNFNTNNGQNIVLNNDSLITCMSASEGSNIEGKSYMLIIVDEAQDVSNFKYSKSISPMGAFYNATKILIGTPSTNKGFFYHAIERNEREHKNKSGRRNHFQYNYKTVMKYNPNYAKYIEGEKRRLGEDSDEFQMSYNLKWILERGMFVDPDKFYSLQDPLGKLIYTDLLNRYVAGVDFGKKSDSTVVTIGKVNYDEPVVVERAKDANAEDFVAHEVKVVNWLEIQGDDYEAQYYEIMDFLQNYNLEKVVLDATGVGSPIFDRMSANLDCEVIPYVFGTTSKSDLYKHLDGEIKSGRMTYVANDDVQKTREFQKFEKQFIDLQKTYSGQNLVVEHPPERGAHDDFPDSCALMVWGAQGEGVSRPVVEKKDPFKETKKMNHSFYTQRNRATARRRR